MGRSSQNEPALACNEIGVKETILCQAPPGEERREMQTTGATGRAGRVRVEEGRKRDRAAEDGALRYPVADRGAPRPHPARLGRSIAELQDGMAARVTDYWGEPFTPPEWRAALAGRLDMPRDGAWPPADLLEGD
jgi:hypothetical protein